ncbi:MAG: hypothetical protein KDA52_02210 [Planctomycetaceae bacterium]|nr:hypothetical protein [Planctomycetaceae bacterium]
MLSEKDLWNHGLRTVFIACTVLMLVGLLPSRAAHADLIWRDHYHNNEAVSNGDVLTDSNGVSITVGTTVYSDSDGGTFDLTPYPGSDYFMFRNQRLGDVRRHLEFGFDNQNNDPADYIELTLTFDTAVNNVNFTLLDIDSGSWDDGVEVFYNGNNNARDNAGISVTTGAYNGVDNESYMHGWEGYGLSADNDETFGNIEFDFGAIQLTSLRIRFFSTDDASSNPGGQVGGLSDVTYTEAVPEPSSVACCLIFAMAFGWTQVRRRRMDRRNTSPTAASTRRVRVSERKPTFPVMPARETSEQVYRRVDRSLQNVA